MIVRRLSAALVAVAGLAVALRGHAPPDATPPPAAQLEVPQRSTVVTVSRTLTVEDYERLLEVPFEVPPGTARIEVSYRVSGSAARTVVDLGLRGPSGLRGWSGGSRAMILVSALGATPGYLPGPIESGRWAVLLGVPNIRAGRTDTVDVTVRLFDAARSAGPAIAGRTAGWFVGDLHTHSAHSDGRTRSRRGEPVGTPPHRVFDEAVRAGLDFVALTDHNTASHWLDVDRLQPYYDDLLLLHGREVTTYRGHAGTVGERAFRDFRLAQPHASPAEVLTPIAADGAFVTINHPALPDGEACMGCGWNVTDADVMRSVHGVEVVNGDTADGPLAGWTFWARMLSAGHRLTAVGGSDEHTIDDDRDRRVGRPATVVHASELSEAALVAGLKAGRAYVRVRGPQGPALVDFHAERHGQHVGMGGDLRGAGMVRLVAVVRGADGQTLQWIVDGAVAAEVVLGAAAVTIEQPIAPGRWFAVRVRDATGPTLISNAIYSAAP